MTPAEAAELLAHAAAACGGPDGMVDQIDKINEFFARENLHPYAVAVALGAQTESYQHAIALLALVSAGRYGKEQGELFVKRGGKA